MTPTASMPQSRHSGRAAPLPPDERRAALIDATLDLLREHGMQVSTRQIAERAGVAEGTIFRVFESKDELIDAALAAIFDPSAMLRQLTEIDVAQPLEARLLEAVTALQEHFVHVFSLMAAAGIVQPPRHHLSRLDSARWQQDLRAAVDRLLEPDRASLRYPPVEVARVLRLLTFAGSHTGIAHGELLTARQIVDIVLHGVRRSDGHGAR